MTFHSLQTPLFQPRRKRHCVLRFSELLGRSWEPPEGTAELPLGLNPFLWPDARGFIWRAHGICPGHGTNTLTLLEVRGAQPAFVLT